MSRLGHEEMESGFEDFGVITVEVKVEMLEGDEVQRKCQRVDILSIGFGLFFVRRVIA
jgi:hypothetical protein